MNNNQEYLDELHHVLAERDKAQDNLEQAQALVAGYREWVRTGSLEGLFKNSEEINNLYRAQADLEKAQALVYAYQDVVKAASRMLRHIDAERKITSTSGGGYGLAADNLRLSLAFILNPNGDAA